MRTTFKFLYCLSLTLWAACASAQLSNINMSVDKVLGLARTIVTIQMTLPQNEQTITRTMLMKRHQRIAPLFEDDFWGTH